MTWVWLGVKYSPQRTRSNQEHNMNRNTRYSRARRLSLLGGLFAVTFGFAAAASDAWPSKPLTFIVPSSAGGGTDIYARLLAEGVGKLLKQTVVVENKPGASGNIG